MLSKMFKKAHKMTREIKAKHQEVDYKAQFGVCLSFLYRKMKEEGGKMVKLEGTEKQVRWAEDIRDNMIKSLNELKENKNLRYHLGRDITVEEVEESLKVLAEIEDSVFFIDNRYEKGTELIVVLEELKQENSIKEEISNNLTKEEKERIIEEVKYVDRKSKDIDTTDVLYDDEREKVKEVINTIREELLKGNIKSIKESVKVIEDKEMLELALNEILLIQL